MVEVVTMRRTWSETKQGLEASELLGKTASHSVFTKQRSRRTRVGSSLWLLQVYK
jgi:hypothetical protein